MSLNQREIATFFALGRRVVELIDATTIAITDVNPSAINLTRNQLAVLVNRAFKEQPGLGSPPTLAEE